MADLETLKRALVNADKAGDAKAARALARAIRREQKEQPKLGAVADAARSAAAGVASGVAATVGVPGTIADAMKSALGAGLSKSYEMATGSSPRFDAGGVERFFASDAPPEIAAKQQSPFSGAALQGYASRATGGAIDYDPQTTAGEYAKTVGEFLPAAAIGGVNPANLLRFGVVPGVTSEAAGQATKETELEPYARFAGAVAGGFMPGIAAKAVTPLPSNPTRANLAKFLDDEGVSLTAGQRTGSTKTRYTESVLGGSAADDFLEAQAEQFTQAILRRVGVDARRATPEVMSEAYEGIGRQFNELSAKYAIVASPNLLKRLMQIRAKYKRDTPSSAATGTIDDGLRDIVRWVRQSGNIPGQQYANLRSELGQVARAQNRTNPQTANAIRDVIEALDDAMEAGIKSVNVDDVGAWREVRRLYRNFLVVERAAAGAGEDAAMGLISPSQLRNATKTVHGARNYTQGKGDFADLARAGEALMKRPPQSGTQPRLSAAVGLPGGVSAGLGAGIGTALTGTPVGAMAGAITGAFAPAIAGRAMLSGAGRSYLGNQVFQNSRVFDPRLAAPGASAISGSQTSRGRK